MNTSAQGYWGTLRDSVEHLSELPRFRDREQLATSSLSSPGEGSLQRLELSGPAEGQEMSSQVHCESREGQKELPSPEGQASQLRSPTLDKKRPTRKATEAQITLQRVSQERSCGVAEGSRA